MRRFIKVLLFAVGGIVVLSVIGIAVVIYLGLSTFSRGSPPTSMDDERLQTLVGDPMYRIRYPNATELRRWEHGSRGFRLGVEDPPTSVYYAGTNDSDDEIIRFFIDKATSNGWYIFRGPGKLSTDVKVSVIFDKDHIGSLFVRTFEPERLNRSLRGEKLPTNYSTIFQVTLRAKHLER